MHKKWWFILIIAIIIVAGLAFYFTFFYTPKCLDLSCFDSSLAKCQRASYTDDKDNAVWEYSIKGREDGKCRVYVSLLQIKEGNEDMAGLEEKNMNCYLPLKSVIFPQSNLDNCHGLLKEEMQKLMINKLFTYINNNLGEISRELSSVI